MRCLGENTEKYIWLSVRLIVTKDHGEVVACKLKFIDSMRFMIHSQENLVNNLSKINVMTFKTCKERCGKISECRNLTYTNNRLIYKCEKCHSKSYKPIGPLTEKFPNTYSICNNDADKLVLLSRKGIYPYEYMDSWERFNETSLPNQEYFNSNLRLEGISNKDHNHGQNVWNTFNMKNLGDYHDLYVQSDALQLAGIFENFRETCIKICRLDPTYFVSAAGLAWQACLKMTKVKLELLTDIDTLLMFEKGIRGGISQAIHKYATANNKYMKSYNKNIPSSYLIYLDADNLYRWAVSKKLPVDNFRLAKNLSLFNEYFIKNYNENSNNRYLFEVDIHYPKELHLHRDLPFLCERKDKFLTMPGDKEKYVVHISALKQALNHGLTRTKKSA